MKPCHRFLVFESVLINLSFPANSEIGERFRQVNAILRAKQLDPKPLESNLLHWSAKQQIRHLHKTDPLDWTPERIAEEFPISVFGAKVSRLEALIRKIFIHRFHISKFLMRIVSFNELLLIPNLGHLQRLLGSNRLLREDQIERHDKEVDARWKLLRQIRRTGRVPDKAPVALHAETIKLFIEGGHRTTHIEECV